jgi:hypothetical protein
MANNYPKMATQYFPTTGLSELSFRVLLINEPSVWLNLRTTPPETIGNN